MPVEETENLPGSSTQGIPGCCKEQETYDEKAAFPDPQAAGVHRRDLGYLEAYMAEGYALPAKYADFYLTIMELYRQQKYMFDNHTHRVEGRIVSISQPYLRPIVREKQRTRRNLAQSMMSALTRKAMPGWKRSSLTRIMKALCSRRRLKRTTSAPGIIPQGRWLTRSTGRGRTAIIAKNMESGCQGLNLAGRPEKASTKREYQDNTDRIEVERFFSLDKRCSGAGLIMTRLSDTTLSSIALSVFVTNLFAIPAGNIFCFILRKAKADQIPSISSNSKQRNTLSAGIQSCS